MINSVSITNFQAHKKTQIDFEPGVNVVTGPSDAGKSSILRAMLWVINNRPSGESIKNWDCKKGDSVNVTIELPNQRISKQRFEGKSNYSLVGDKPLIFEAFKQDVPSEVAEALNLTNINIQTQHDSYFLLNNSPGEVARILNELTGLDVIDKLFKHINSKTLGAKREIDTLEKNISGYDEELQKLAYIDALEADLDELEKLVEEKEKKQEIYKEIQIILGSLVYVDAAINRKSFIIKAETDVEALLDCCGEYTRKSFSVANTKRIVSNINDIESRIKENKDWLAVEKDYTGLADGIESVRERISMVFNVRNLTDKLIIMNKTIDETIAERESMEKEYRDTLKKHKICPLCKTKVNDKMIEEILK